MKIVVNKCYGGFSLSYEAVMLYAKLKGITLYASVNDHTNGYNHKKFVPYVPEDNEKDYILIHYHSKPLSEGDINQNYFSPHDIERNDPVLIKVVETLGNEKASGSCADLHIVEIPDDVNWQIGEYDGQEWVEEVHRTWS